MKEIKIIIAYLILTIIISINAHAQWTRSNSNVHLSYSDDNVGIGTSTPNIIGFGSTNKVVTIQSNSGASIVEFAANRTSDGQSVGWYEFINSNNRLFDFIVTRQNNGKSGSMIFRTNNGSGGLSSSNMIPRFTVNHDGTVGIGTTTTGTHKLAVDGSIGAKKIIVEANGWSDFVFEKDYPLPTLAEIETHILEKEHLIGIPSAKEIEEIGINLGQMDSKLLQKIEELTLYIIQQHKESKQLRKEINALKRRLVKLETKS